MLPIIQVALGGALGAVARFAVIGWAARAFGPAFPWGVLGVNLLGSFLMGVLVGLAATYPILRDGGLPPFLMAGFLGAFTTFSAFSLDVFRLVEGGASLRAALYVGVSVLGSILALFAGVSAARAGVA